MSASSWETFIAYRSRPSLRLFLHWCQTGSKNEGRELSVACGLLCRHIKTALTSVSRRSPIMMVLFLSSWCTLVMQSMNGLLGLPTTIGSKCGRQYLNGADRAPDPVLHIASGQFCSTYSTVEKRRSKRKRDSPGCWAPEAVGKVLSSFVSMKMQSLFSLRYLFAFANFV